jgi:hypothetical protein
MGRPYRWRWPKRGPALEDGHWPPYRRLRCGADTSNQLLGISWSIGGRWGSFAARQPTGEPAPSLCRQVLVVDGLNLLEVVWKRGSSDWGSIVRRCCAPLSSRTMISLAL